MRSMKIVQTALRGSRYFFTNAKYVASAKQEAIVKGGKDVITSNQKTEVMTAEESEKRPSFAKDLLLGKFDTAVLTYPEVLDKDRLETLYEMLKPIERFYEEKVDSKKIDIEGKIPKETLDGLKELGLFGQQAPPDYGGLGLNATEYARVQEITSLDGGIAVTLAAHQAIGFKGLLLYGTEEQKKKYLPKLVSGETIAAFALTEPGSGSDAASIQTKATLSDDGKTWYLSGSKIWISNGGIADFFTVFARTADDSAGGVKSHKKLSAFLVERKFGGVTSGKPEDKLGVRGSNTTEIHFDQTPVPVENMLGTEGDGFKIAVNILNSGRFSMGSSSAGGIKKIIEAASDYAINRKQFGRPLKDFGLIQEKFARMAINAYVMESMSYLTAGMIDSGEYEDCAVESAIVKVFSSEGMWNMASECLQIFGGIGYMKDYPLERILRDVRILPIFEGTNEILRLFIALMGLQHAGKGLKDLVKKLRNPFQNPTLVFQKAFQQSRQVRDNPKLILNLKSYVHPALEESANLLEYSVLRLQFGVELALRTHGKEVVDAQFDLKRIADSIIDIYAMTSSISRASRSHCTGLRNSDLEVSLVRVFCEEATERVKNNIRKLQQGKLNTNDVVLKNISDKIMENKSYCFEHPLTRNI